MVIEMHHDFFRAVFWALVLSFFFLVLLVRLVLCFGASWGGPVGQNEGLTASGEALDVHNSVCFVWFSAHCCFCSLFGLGSGQDAPGGVKLRYLEGSRAALVADRKIVLEGATSRYRGCFRLVFYDLPIACCSPFWNCHEGA